ncbi:MAG: serine hydrolase [bacterium]|nr:serine hydrolase [bacterium]
MVKIKPVLKRVQKVGNAIGSYILGNVAAAAALHSGIEDWNKAVSQPDWLQNAQFYGGLLAFNAGIFVPSIREGVGNYAKDIFGYKQDRPVPLQPYLKSALLVGALGFGLANDSIWKSSRDALEKIGDDVATLIHYEKKVGVPKPGPPVQPGDVGYQKLEGDITAYINNLRSRNLARARGIEDYSLFAKDLRSGEVFLDINTNVPRLAASTNKMYVLLAAEHEVDAGRLAYTDQLEKNLVGMIRSSNNSSTDWVIDQVGGAEKVNAIVQDYGFEDTVVEKINQAVTGGRTLGNKTSAEDLAELLEKLYHGDLPRSDDMRRILSLKASGHADRIFDRTCIPGDPKFLTTNGGYIESVENKTGFIWGANTDAGLVTSHFYNRAKDETSTVPYVVAFLIEDENAKPDGFRGDANAWGRAKSETMRSISEATFWALEKRYSDISPSCKAHNGVHPK